MKRFFLYVVFFIITTFGFVSSVFADCQDDCWENYRVCTENVAGKTGAEAIKAQSECDAEKYRCQKSCGG